MQKPFPSQEAVARTCRMVLERLQGIDDNRLIVYMDELLRDILVHSGAASGGSQQCYIHGFSSLFYLHPAGLITMGDALILGG